VPPTTCLLPRWGGTVRTTRAAAHVEVATVDTRHRLVLVRRDGVEHLVLLGANSDLLIESNIEAPDQPPSSDAASFQQTLRTAGEQKP